MNRIAWFFECPVHGIESEVFCFRAFDENLKSNWKKIELKYVVIETTDKERDDFIKSFEKNF